MRGFQLALFALTLFALVAAPSATAHKTTTTPDGKVKIIWGFLNEPATTWTKNGLDLILRDNATNAPITGQEKNFEATLILGDEERRFHLQGQHGKPGSYTDVVTLTAPGLYKLKLVGTINGSAVDMVIPAAHDVDELEGSMFPVKAKSPAALEAEIAALKSEIQALKLATKGDPDTSTVEKKGGAATPGLSAALLVGALGLVAVLAARRSR